MVLPRAGCVKAVFFPSLTKQGTRIEDKQYMLLLRLLKLFHIKSHKQPKKRVSGRHRKYCPVDKTGWKLYSAATNGSLTVGRIYQGDLHGITLVVFRVSLMMSNI